MPMKVVYANVNGQLLSETRAGARKLYSLDPLGNTRALYDNTLTKTDTFEYFPSGTVAARTGTTPTPFQWVGGSGYYRDNSKRVHVRARNFYVNLGRWAETDPIGFGGGDYNLYRYVKNRFVVATDPSGLDCRVKSINVSLGDKICKAKSSSFLGLCTCDEYKMEANWQMQWTLQKDSNPDDCWVNQFYQVSGRGGVSRWFPDDATGWPYPQTCTQSRTNTICNQYDTPGMSSSNSVLCFLVPGLMEHTFLTCLCGSQGTVACYYWYINFNVDSCVVNKCVAKILGPVKSPSILNKACQGGAGGQHQGWQP